MSRRRLAGKIILTFFWCTSVVLWAARQGISAEPSLIIAGVVDSVPEDPRNDTQSGSETGLPATKVSTGATAAECININTSGLETLVKLPGVGPVLAQRIIDYRNAHGQFQSLKALDEVKGIGPAKLEKLRTVVCW